MFTFTVPSSIILKDLITGQPGEAMSFRKHAYMVWFCDFRWSNPNTNIDRLIKVMPEFEKKPGEVIQLEDQDYSILSAVIRTPSDGSPALGPLVQVQLRPFKDIVLNAKEVVVAAAAEK